MFETIALLSFVLTGLLLALAHPLTLVVLGPEWEAAAVIFANFTIAALTYPPTSASTWLFASQGRGKDWVLASSVVSVVTLCSFLVGLPFGARRCSDILFGRVCPNTGAICLLRGRPARYGKRERPLDRKLAAFACLGSGLRHDLVCTYLCFECSFLDPITLCALL